MRIIPDMWRYAELCTRQPMGDIEFMNEPAIFTLRQPLVFIPMKNDTDYGYFAEYPERIIIGFQGTGTGGDKGLRSWLSNFDSFPAINGVHESFFNSAEMFYGTIVNQIKKIPGKELFITGHSRGGSLSKCLAMMLSERQGWKSSVLAFGAPTPFLKEGRNRFNKLPIDLLNVIHGYEFTQYLPPRILGFRYAGRKLWLPEPRWHKVFCKIKDHFYSTTNQAIKKWCKEHGDTEGIAVCNEISLVAKP